MPVSWDWTIENREEHFHHQLPHSTPCPATLREGHNEILVRFEAVAARECPYVLALQIVGLSSDDASQENSVFLPTSNEAVARRQTLERMFEAAYLDRDVYIGDDEIILRLPHGMSAPASAAVRLQTPSGRIHLESLRVGPTTPLGIPTGQS